MKYFVLAVSFLILCAFTYPAFASGVLVDTKGAVTVTLPDGKNAAAKTGVELPDGTKISVGKGSSASVMMMDGSIQEIGAGEKYTVGSTQKPGGQRTVIQGIALAMNEATETASGPTVHGMVKMGQLGPGAPKPGIISLGNALGPQGIFPVETTLDVIPEITFQWSKTAKIAFANPTIVIEDTTGKRILTKRISPANPQITVKAGELGLAPGNSYVWYLASDENGKILGKGRRNNFGIISAADKNKLDEDKNKIAAMGISEDGKKFLTAQLFYRVRMLDTMVRELLPLWQKDHADAVKKLLFLGYARMGLAEEAKKYQ